ncbi:hypothetical protein UNSWDHB_571 [Dehalobacter sp. UNSWDHB]|nr:hypothetical protein DHBDCA_p1257 [Dehalobacter sp. DCA]AFV05329.1 hypothetical protein DCF50_p1323 [Dehalobacter sp. CF]EQB22124.1 hypothetical protein UNSWDHB_571 [Dehalobacter sp. UNSWDHB]
MRTSSCTGVGVPSFLFTIDFHFFLLEFEYKKAACSIDTIKQAASFIG